MSASAVATDCPDAFICSIMVNGPMQDPVIASDGHTYERTGITRWLERSANSPMTGKQMPDKRLVPNHTMKSQIEQWRDKQRGHNPRQEQLDAILNKIRLCTTSDEVTATLSAISEFVVETETLIPAEQLKRVGKMLDGDEKLWSEAVKGALEVVEAQCEAVRGALPGKLKLRRAKLLYMTSVKVNERNNELTNLGQMIRESKEEVARLKVKLKGEEERGKLLTAQHSLHLDKQKQLRTIENRYREEVVRLQRGLGKAAESEEERGGGSGARGATRATPDMGAVYVEGLQWYDGSNFRKRDELRGQVMVEAAADAGVASAEAMCIWRGWGRPQNTDEAFKSWERLIEHDDGGHQAIAMDSLAICYEIGNGVAKDETAAVEWYTKAAEAGHTQAMYNLGRCYEHGKGVAKDVAKAVEWYTKGADAGHILAMNNLGACYERGKGVAKAVEWYTRAAEEGEMYAMNNLGRCYEYGMGVAKDEAKAVVWYAEAAEAWRCEPHRHPLTGAMHNLGRCYEHGKGVAKDRAKAVEWYTKAAEAGDMAAMNNLGVCYEHGIGVAKDFAKAVEWYTKAADVGHKAGRIHAMYDLSLIHI